jgi:hypothetical protein
MSEAVDALIRAIDTALAREGASPERATALEGLRRQATALAGEMRLAGEQNAQEVELDFDRFESEREDLARRLAALVDGD